MNSKAIAACLEDGRVIKLSASDWIGEGGEGCVYKKQGLAIKIIEDKAALSKKEPKLKIFRSIKHPLLATPISLAYDAGGALIGYAMPMIEGLPLARLMSPAWRAQNGYGDAKLEEVGKSMVEAIQALHAANAWGGDINEFNWRVKTDKAVLIDCDSWGCVGHAVSAMLPSIADPVAQGRFEAPSDWYGLAVLLFGMFAGIHPFRGSLPGYGPKDMAIRMAAGASLLKDGAGWPASVPGPDGLPKGLRPWLEATLGGALREAPPHGDWGKMARVAKAVKSSGTIDLPSGFDRWAASGLALLQDGTFFDMASKRVHHAPSPDAGRWVDPDSGESWWIWQQGQQLLGRSMDGASSFNAPMPALSKLRFWSGEPFVIKEGGWSVFAIRRLGAQGVKAMAAAQGVSGLSCEDFDGCMVCASMGSYAMLRPIGKYKGAMAIALPPLEPGARIAMASCQGSYEFVEWALPSGMREVRVTSKGKPIGAVAGGLDWASRIGEDGCLAQIDGKGWWLSNQAMRPWAAWASSSAPACCHQGELWRVEAGQMQAKAYSLAKLAP
jgi:hypothetical protein